MAVVYFTSNASTGAGSLAEAIRNAQPGDVVRPDETVFERGSTIEIALASSITLDKNLTVDATPFRVRLDGGKRLRCVLVSPNVTVEFQDFEFVAGKRDNEAGGGVSVSRRASAVFRRCVFAGCQGSAGGGLYCSSETEVQLYECVATGCCATSGNGGGVASSGRLIVSGSTIYGNVASGVGADLRSANETVVVNSLIGFVSANLGDAPGVVVGVASSAVGFVVSPPDDLTPEDWNANLWQDWDLRLLDDASPLPSPYRDSGDVGEMSQYDLQGNFRGRKTNGVATCSPGAYETIQADLFWVGEPFPQTLVDIAPQNLVASNFVATSETRASIVLSWTIPENADYSAIEWRYATNASPNYWQGTTLDGKLESRKANYVLGRIYTVRIRGLFADGSYTAWSYATFPTDESLNDETGGGQTTGTTLPSALSVVNPSFQTSVGWATSRFSTSFSDVAPQVGQKLFVDGAVVFDDVLTTANANGQRFALTFGGGANVRFPSATVHLFELQTGAASTFTFTNVRPNEARFGDWSRLAGTFSALPKYDVGSQVYIQAAQLYSFAQPEATYGVLTVYAQKSPALQLDGAYRCDEFRIYAGATASDVCAITAPGTTVRARVVNWGSASSTVAERLVSEPITLILQDAASLTLPDAAPESWADAFAVDLSEATSATLTLNDQTVYGDAPTAEITLNGAAKVVERGLDVASLTLNDGATLTVETATLTAETLTLAADSVLTVDGGNVNVAELSVADGATVAFSPAESQAATGGANGTAGTAATNGASATNGNESTYVDAILTATETATVGDATFTGTGYFATPPETDLTAANFADAVRACDYGAGISAFSAVATSPTEAAIEWSATDETATVCVERKTSSGWEVVDVRGESGLTAAIATPGATVFRAFDGAAFWSDSAWFLTGEQFAVETDFYVVAEEGGESLEYETETHIVTTNIDKSIYWGQSLTFLARIRNAFTGDLLLNDGTRTKGVRYSLYRREGSLFSTSEDDVPVRLDVDAGAACLLEAAQTSDAWPGVEYNFALIPANSADEPLIPAPGNYVLRVFVELTTGNPIVFVYTFAAR